ncbi:hypothetical protein QFC20_004809 [Naganishia adeliensis]|uniref:Uncharacterized protein n=1 Tax=Naganishia adeliensis TaxID=92952 RepID=A0ACC2VWT8_9TREE|nr:hypothetical protein QFC20_004809 [Naganishia adeliensis]
MGGFSRFLNKITKSDDGSAQAQVGQQGGPPAAYHVQQPQQAQMAQHGSGKRVVGYFTNWGIYGPKYFPNMIPAPFLTHVMYSFANVKPDTGTVVLTDSWADVEIHYDGDSWNDAGTNLYGNFKALYKLKQANRNLKVLLSIGGWSYRENFRNLVNPAHRAEFARSAVAIVEDVGLDGLDIDWEYPDNHAEQQALVDLLRLCREGLDGLARNKGKPGHHYELSIAAPCGSHVYEKLMIPELDRYLDFWNLMAYDLSGSWSSTADHQAALFASNPGSPCIDTAVNFYRSRGVPSQKIVLGIPAYGRRFQNTGGIGHPFHGVGPDEGLVAYRNLQTHGCQVIEDAQRGSSYTYNPHAKELISYDSPNIAVAKAQYINRNNLGGAMFWSLELDRRPGEDQEMPALIPLMARQMEGGLLGSENELSYPFSKYDNLRSGQI